MFILPDTEPEHGIDVNLVVGQVMGEIEDIRGSVGENYPFRLGLAYGTLLIEQIGGRDYSEWTAFGEAIHLAKRLHEFPK